MDRINIQDLYNSQIPTKSVDLLSQKPKMKDLLRSELLLGQPVYYKSGGQPKIAGEIMKSGILCWCSLCLGKQTVTMTQFELHAGSTNKRPAEYICLEKNGNSLRDVLNKWRSGVPLGFTPEAGVAQSRPLCGLHDLSEEAPRYETTGSSISEASSNLPEIRVPGNAQISYSSKPQVKAHGRLKKKYKTTVSSISKASSNLPGIRAPGSAQLSSSSKSQKKAHGRLKKKDSRKNKEVLDTISIGSELSFIIKKEKKLVGFREGIGIKCKCCNEEWTPTEFEDHAGFGKRRNAYRNIFTSDGQSLHQLSKKIRLSKEKDYLCTANALAAKSHAGIDVWQEMKQQCIQSDRTMVDEVGECSLCGGHFFSNSGFDDNTIIYCDQCEKEYHVGCLRLLNIDNLKEVPQEEWFCCTQCENIRSTLLKLIEEGGKGLSEASLNIVNKKCEKEGSVNIDSNINWRLLNCASASVNNKQLLDTARALFSESFGSIVDPSKSNTDLITKMVSGSESTEHNYTGMYCAILTVNSFVVSVGLVRIFGKEVAELPLVATKTEFQGKGYFQALFNCIENLLESLEVENLVLPATHKAVSMWKQKFGFEKLKLNQRKLYQKKYPIVNFAKTTMLHKSLLPF